MSKRTPEEQKAWQDGYTEGQADEAEDANKRIAAVESELADLVAALKAITRETWPAECEPICNILRALVARR